MHTVQVIDYLRQKYPLKAVGTKAALAVITGNMSS
jgi:hypothetical protein